MFLWCWVDLGVGFSDNWGGGGNAKRESPDLRSQEVDISKVLLLMSLLTITMQT